MIRCSNCGRTLLHDEDTCPYCGVKTALDYPEPAILSGKIASMSYSLKNTTRKFFDRAFLSLFNRRVKTDIANNNHTLEMIFLWLISIILMYIPSVVLQSELNPSPNSDYNGYLFIAQIRILVDILMIFFLTGFSQVGNLISRKRTSYRLTMQMIIYTRFPFVLLEVLIFVVFPVQSSFYPLTSTVNATMTLLLQVGPYILELIFLILAYQTLFLCKLRKAAVIFLSSYFITFLMFSIYYYRTNIGYSYFL